MKTPGVEIGIAAAFFTERRTSKYLYASAVVPACVRAQLGLEGGVSSMYFHYLARGESPVHLMLRKSDRPECEGPYMLQRNGAISLPESFILPDDRVRHSVKIAFISTEAETALFGRLDGVINRLGYAAMQLGDERLMGELLMAQYNSTHTPADLTIATGPVAGMPVMPHLVQQAFPELNP